MFSGLEVKFHLKFTQLTKFKGSLMGKVDTKINLIYYDLRCAWKLLIKLNFMNKLHQYFNEIPMNAAINMFTKCYKGGLNEFLILLTEH